MFKELGAYHAVLTDHYRRARTSEQTLNCAPDFDQHGLQISVVHIQGALVGHYPYPEGTRMAQLDFYPFGHDSAQTNNAPRIYLELYDGLTGLFSAIDANDVTSPDVFHGITDVSMARAFRRFGFQAEDQTPDISESKNKTFLVTGDATVVRQTVLVIGANRTAAGKPFIEKLRERVGQTS